MAGQNQDDFELFESPVLLFLAIAPASTCVFVKPRLYLTTIFESGNNSLKRPVCSDVAKMGLYTVKNPEQSTSGLAREAVVQRCSVKKVFLKISQNSQENTCTRFSFLIKS